MRCVAKEKKNGSGDMQKVSALSHIRLLSRLSLFVSTLHLSHYLSYHLIAAVPLSMAHYTNDRLGLGRAKVWQNHVRVEWARIFFADLSPSHH